MNGDEAPQEPLRTGRGPCAHLDESNDLLMQRCFLFALRVSLDRVPIFCFLSYSFYLRSLFCPRAHVREPVLKTLSRSAVLAFGNANIDRKDSVSPPPDFRKARHKPESPMLIEASFFFHGYRNDGDISRRFLLCVFCV